MLAPHGGAARRQSALRPKVRTLLVILAPAVVTVIATARLASPAPPTGSCQFTSVVGVSFGTYDVFSTSPTASTGRVTFQCNHPAKSVTIDLSRGGSATYFPRRMPK